MKHCSSVICLLLMTINSFAQGNGSAYSNHNYQRLTVKAKVLDVKTKLAIPNVTVYLIPQGDTTITNFSLSDGGGQIVLEKVVAGKYELNAELLGYDSYSKIYDIDGHPGWDVDLGTIGMKENIEGIDAATITAAGNPITIQDDTVIYNASSFRVGENARLEDLLRKMPGMVVSDDGTATVNGEKVDRITIGGKTFFFGDPSMALKNLPAKIVERIKVSRQESRSSQMGGISTEIDKETVMDVELKEEYREGWFGDARLGAGATLNDDKDNPLTQDTKFLYDGSAMASIFGKTDQLVLIGNAYNIENSDGGGSAYVPDLPQDDFANLGGLTTAIRGGVNYNTDRIRNFETTVSANYRHSTKDDRQRYSRTSFVSDKADFKTDGGTDATGKEDQLMIDFELYKEQGKLLVDFTPRFYLRKSSTDSYSFANTSAPGTSSETSTTMANAVTDNRQLLANGSLGLTGTSLGKEGRRLGFNLDYSIGGSGGNRLENSDQSVDYDILGKKLDLDGELFYYEPLGQRWGVEASIGSVLNSDLSDRRAFNPDGTGNERLTNRAGQRFLQEGASVLMQYSNDTSSVRFGVTTQMYNDVLDAEMYGSSTVAGRGVWKFNWSPVAIYSWSRNGHDLNLQYSSVTDPASIRLMIPVPDISNPTQITAGNIYLKSSISNSLTAYYNMVNYTTYTFLTVYATTTIEGKGTVYASWFDNTGTRYAVPVNAQRPGTNVNAYAVLNQPFGKEKNFTFSFSAQANYNNRFSYQSKTVRPGFDLNSFDYKAFMDDFWGDESGNRFYGGLSGFSESKTKSTNWGLGLDLKYNKGIFTGIVTASAGHNKATYSLNSAADINVWDYNIGGDLLFQPGKGWEIGTDVRYVFYRGYAQGFGEPELRWNLSLGKTIKSVTLGLKANDILNQQRNLTHTVSSAYVEDSYRNVIGRTLLFSVSFNFGKLNSDRTSAISKAINKMDY